MAAVGSEASAADPAKVGSFVARITHIDDHFAREVPLEERSNDGGTSRPCGNPLSRLKIALQGFTGSGLNWYVPPQAVRQPLQIGTLRSLLNALHSYTIPYSPAALTEVRHCAVKFSDF
jgi:hypothetical protein